MISFFMVCDSCNIILTLNSKSKNMKINRNENK